WLARLPDADQGGLSVPRLDSRGADCSRPSFVPRLGAACGDARHPRMAEFLFQVAHDRAGTLPRTRFIHPVHEAEKHFALYDGRGFDHALGAGILRLKHRSGSGESQILWVLPLISDRWSLIAGLCSAISSRA